ncbi:MAG: hypothetical protein AAFW70_14500 [Cyanobacteria bacterium J06635_10]
MLRLYIVFTQQPAFDTPRPKDARILSSLSQLAQPEFLAAKVEVPTP